MGNCLKIFVTVFAISLTLGCASPKGDSTAIEKSAAQRYHETHEAVADANQAVAGHKLVKRAHTAIGTPYVFGGSNPGGFDCSGFVKWAYKGVGVQLPRTAREQSVVGKKISNIEDMRAGDIVAFRHPKRGYHTGIYVGDGKFIHSPRRRTTVRINSLDDPYFSKTLLGARRVSMDGSENIISQAQERLLAMESLSINKSRKSLKSGSYSKEKAGSKKITSVASNSKKSKKIILASKANKKATKLAAKSGKKSSTVAANNAKTSRHAITKGKSKSRTIAHNTAPVKAPAKQVASRKNNHKAVSLLHHTKSQKHPGKNSRS